MKLYELTELYQALLDTSEGATPKAQEEFGQALSAIDETFDLKIENIAKVIQSLRAGGLAIQAEESRLAGRRQIIERKTDWLKRYIQTALEAVHKDRVEGYLLTVSLRKSPPSCVVIDQDQIPGDFRTETVQVKIDRKGIIDHFKQTGETVQGVEIVTDKRTVSIR